MLLTLIALFLHVTSAYFPRGSCPAQPCSRSPYNFVWTNVTPGSFCFSVVPTHDCQGECCDRFEQMFVKFVINTLPWCKTAFQQVNVNGLKKGGGVFYDLYGINNSESELRVTSMSYNNVTIANVTFCILSAPPCDTLDTFCNGQCKFSVYDPFTHTCCPTCFFNSTVVLTPSPWIRSPFSSPRLINSPPPPPSPLINSPPPPPSPLINSPPPPSPLINSPPPPSPLINSPPPPPSPLTSPPNPSSKPVTLLKCNCTCV